MISLEVRVYKSAAGKKNVWINDIEGDVKDAVRIELNEVDKGKNIGYVVQRYIENKVGLDKVWE